MEPDTKYSRFMFHLKFSQTDNYLNEHELYEVMRSRNLYQTQFGVRSNFKKIMRNLYIDEKQTRYGFENTRKMFVQKMKERREQIDKLRDSTSYRLNSLSTLQEKEKKKVERQYVQLPQATFVYTGLPPIETTSHENNFKQPPSQNNSNKPDDATLLPPSPLPSMVGTVYADDQHSNKSKSVLNDNKLQGEQKLMTSNVLVVGMTGHQTITKKKVESKKAHSDGETFEQLINTEDLYSQFQGLHLTQKEEEKRPHSENVFEQKTKLGEGEAQVSTVCLTNTIPNNFSLKKTKALPSESKVQFWAEQHGILENKDEIRKEADFQRLLIDRPSKWVLNHYHEDLVQSKLLDMRLQYSDKIFKRSLDKRKSRQLDNLSERLLLKQRLSLPELNTTPRPMVSIDPGGTTPDGRLILTKADYEDYLSDYRKARNVRLERTKKRNRNLQKKIEGFVLEPKLCLKDDTCLRASMHTI